MSDLSPVTLFALPGIPLVKQGDNLLDHIVMALRRAELRLQTGDVIVVTSKIVSKAEGRLVDIRTVTPNAEAYRIAGVTGKDPRIVELVLRESTSVSRMAPNLLITRHRLGFTSANAGIDQSNVGGDDHFVLLLPLEPDKSAEAIRDGLWQETGVAVGVVISDSHGRPFRMGNVGVAIGVAGMPALLDLRGKDDLFGRALRVTTQGYADLVASAAHLVSGEAGEGLPVVLVRGLKFPQIDGHACDLNRPFEYDLYR